MAIKKNTVPATSRKNTTGKTLYTYTVRYRDAVGKQRQETFGTRKEAEKFERDEATAKTYGNDVDLKAGKGLFTDVAESYVKNLAGITETTRNAYLGVFRKYISEAYKGKTVREAARDRAIAELLVNVTMLHLVINTRRMARMIIVGALDSAIASGAIESHRLAGIKFAEKQATDDDSEAEGFVFITDDQVATLAERVGICVWLQRCMGLRIGEALGVEKADFINGGKTLRLKSQASRDGRKRVPLKHRKQGQFRDVPVPEFIWAKVQAMPDGPLMPGISTKYMQYCTVRDRFYKACAYMGIKAFTTHSLRHQFASECLEAGMNIVDLSEVLGHSDPSITLKIYVHAMPDAFDRTRDMMDARWSTPRLKAA